LKVIKPSIVTAAGEGKKTKAQVYRVERGEVAFEQRTKNLTGKLEMLLQGVIEGKKTRGKKTRSIPKKTENSRLFSLITA